MTARFYIYARKQIEQNNMQKQAREECENKNDFN